MHQKSKTEIENVIGIAASTSTITRVLKKHDLKSFHAVKKPNKNYQKKRLKFAQDNFDSLKSF